jgi:hypothetical protein
MTSRQTGEAVSNWRAVNNVHAGAGYDKDRSIQPHAAANENGQKSRISVKVTDWSIGLPEKEYDPCSA